MTSTYQLRRTLRALYEQHGVRPCATTLSLADKDDARPVLEGLASAPTIDVDRVKFLPHAFVLPKRSEDCPLLLEHEDKRVVGRIEDLSYSASGSLLIRAHVKDEAARRMPAFSVSARPLSWSVHDGGSSSFWIEISFAELVEISLTARPRNGRALVQSRHPLAPLDETHERLLASFARMQTLLQSLKEQRA